MARAMRIHCLEQDRDPREYALIAFGGAGPVHAYRLAQAVGIQTAIFPAGAGVMSAYGFLVARPSIELIRAYVTLLDDADAATVDGLFGEMEAEGRELLASAGVRPSQVAVRREAAVRYAGQSYELIVPVPNGKLTKAKFAATKRAFEGLYQHRYHRLTPNVSIEVVSWHATISGPAPTVRTARASSKTLRAARKGTRKAYFPELGGFVETPVYDRYALGPGLRFRGPAIVEERESTAVIGPGAGVEVDRQRNLRVDVRGLEAAKVEKAANGRRAR